MSKARINLLVALEPWMVEEIDKRRGQVPRVAYIRNLLNLALVEAGKHDMLKGMYERAMSAVSNTDDAHDLHSLLPGIEEVEKHGA